MVCPLHISQSMLSSISGKLVLDYKSLMEQQLQTMDLNGISQRAQNGGRNTCVVLLGVVCIASVQTLRRGPSQSPDCSHFLSPASHMASGLFIHLREC